MSYIRLLILIGALIWLWGCGRSEPLMPPGLEEISAHGQQLLWEQYLGQASALTPDVYWQDSTCTSQSGLLGVLLPDRSTCVGGYFIHTINGIFLPAQVSNRLSDTGFAHEHIHAWLWVYGISDPKHERPEWTKMQTEMDVLLRNEGL